MHYILHPHHLTTNIVLQLVVFVTLCEGFLGIEPRLVLWRRLFFFKKLLVKDSATGGMRMTCCGAGARAAPLRFPVAPLFDSANNWQRGFFYVKNLNPACDHVNLPAFFDAPTVEKLNWKVEMSCAVEEVDALCFWLEHMFGMEGLTVVDLLVTMVSRRI
ncbi:hypothetical protein D1007_56318 [Hordeum vulgare]|nr:hypothetical protein D1007_56318 [Hordeum vulgare]